VTNELKEDSRTFVPDSDLMELLAEWLLFMGRRSAWTAKNSIKTYWVFWGFYVGEIFYFLYVNKSFDLF
jgi:hypothetical protein